MIKNYFSCQFRCKECGYLPLIEIYFKNNSPYFKYICPNNHYKSDIILENLSIVSTSLICSKCNKTKTINDCFLFNNKIYCNECKENDENFIKIKDIDSKCLIHNSEFKCYCKTHNKNLCNFCEKISKNCEIVEIKKFSDFYIKNLLFEINNSFGIFQRLKNYSIEIQEKINFNFFDSLENFIEINEILLNFLKKQILIYQNNCKNFIINNQNYLNVKNIKINDINNLNSKFIEEIENAQNFEEFSNNFFNSNNFVFKNNVSNSNINNNFFFNNEQNLNKDIKNNSNENFNENSNEKSNENYLDINEQNINYNLDNFEIEKKEKTTISNQPENILSISQKYKKIFNFQIKISCLKILSNNDLSIGFKNGTIQILINNFTSKIVIEKHTNSVLFIEELKNKNIVSCSRDCSIKIFKLFIEKKYYEMIQDINFNNKTIFKVFQLSNENLFSCCEDKTLIEWKLEKNHNKNEFVPIKILDCEESCEDAIEIKYNNSLFENKKEIVSCSFNEESLYFWDLESMFKIYKIFDVENLGNNNELFLFKYEFLLIAGKIFLTLINIYKKEKTFLLKTDFICLNIDNFNDNILIADFKGFFHQFKITKNGIQKVENKNHFQFDFGFRFLNCLKKSEDNNFLFVSSDYDLKLYEISNN